MRKLIALIIVLTTFIGKSFAQEKELWINNGSRRIFGVLCTPQNVEKKKVAIISHGFNGTHHFGRDYYKTLNDLGYEVYSFDFPGGSVNSRSDNNTMHMSVIDQKNDLEAIVKYFRRQKDVDKSNIVLIGESQGGFVSALAASELKSKISRLILIYPALCIPDNWNSRYKTVEEIPDTTNLWNVKLSRRFFLELRDMNVYDLIPRYKGPVLIVHGSKDAVVNLQYSENAVKCYKDARLKIIEGAGHGFKPEERVLSNQYVSEFLSKAEDSASYNVTRSLVVEDGGTGSCKAIMEEVSNLPDHTVFMPQDLSKFNKKNPLPVIVWGNGACVNCPWGHFKFLNEIASQGYLVIATGFMPLEDKEYPTQMSTSEEQMQSIDWALAENKNPNSPLYNKVNPKAICAAGMSCGGLQTLYNCGDKRITTYMIMNSGLFIDPQGAIPNMPMPSKTQLMKIHGPIIYVLGGTEDIAYTNGMDDFHRIQHVPAVAINYPVGHAGTYRQPHGGEFRFPAIAWLNWQLKKDKEASKMFVGSSPDILKRDKWSLEKNKLVK